MDSIANKIIYACMSCNHYTDKYLFTYTVLRKLNIS